MAAARSAALLLLHLACWLCAPAQCGAKQASARGVFTDDRGRCVLITTALARCVFVLGTVDVYCMCMRRQYSRGSIKIVLTSLHKLLYVETARANFPLNTMISEARQLRFSACESGYHGISSVRAASRVQAMGAV